MQFSRPNFWVLLGCWLVLWGHHEAGDINNTLNHYSARGEQFLCWGKADHSRDNAPCPFVLSLQEAGDMGAIVPVCAFAYRHYIRLFNGVFRFRVETASSLSLACLYSHCPFHLACFPSPLSFLANSADPSGLRPISPPPGGIQHLGEGHDGGDKHQPMDACNSVHLL